MTSQSPLADRERAIHLVHTGDERTLNERGQERQARPLVVGCSTETGSDAGKVFLRASSSASSWRLRSPCRDQHRFDEICVSDRP